MVVLRGQARRTFRDPAKSSNFGSVTSLPGELSTKMPAQRLASRACSAEVVQLVSLAAFRQPWHRCSSSTPNLSRLSLNHHRATINGS